jgi:hypothetical protein
MDARCGVVPEFHAALYLPLLNFISISQYLRFYSACEIVHVIKEMRASVSDSNLERNVGMN